MTTVCLLVDTIDFPEGGGLQWNYLNWALGLRANGCRVIWMERVPRRVSPGRAKTLVGLLRSRLDAHGLADLLALVYPNGKAYPKQLDGGCLDLDAATEADLLINMSYQVSAAIVRRFRRSAVVDLDPGLTQLWISSGVINIPRHDVYFTTGETVGLPGVLFPDCGIRWHFVPEAVYLPAWPFTPADQSRPFTTVSSWWGKSAVKIGDKFCYNTKREGFRPFLDMPKHTRQPLELALAIPKSESGQRERRMLERRGWRVQYAEEVASDHLNYQQYIQSSRGEFTCVKPSCVRLQNAWIGDRTICYLASGKPVITQHTGPSRLLPESEGMFRFRTLAGATRAFKALTTDYERHSRAARALAEEVFSAEKVMRRVLEVGLA